MDAFDPFIEHINKRIALTSTELAELLSYFSEKKIKKNQFLILPGVVPKYRSYVVKGAFRAYVVDEKGEEHTIQFAIEDWWTTDYNSYIYQVPAIMYVEALEDSVVLQIDYNNEQKAKNANHKFETFFRIMAERSAAFHQRRIISNLMQTAAERYDDFIEKYPLVAQRVPQYALASYLMMTTGFLSRIRNKIPPTFVIQIKTKYMSGKLKNKVAVVTGGSSGIGLATAKLFAEQGAKVAITGRNLTNLNNAIAEIGHGAIGVQGDVAKISDLTRLFGTVEEKLGKIDVLIANAAVYMLAPLASFTEEMFDKVNDINYKGTFFTVQKALPHLNDGASVVLTSSVVAEKGVPNHSAYSASKAAVRSLARSFSTELMDRKIRVNVLTPGPVDTPVFETITTTKEEADAVKAGMGQFAPIKRVATTTEIAEANLFLASDTSAFMIGSEILIDGGIRSL